MFNKILLVALEKELPINKVPYGYEIIYTGVGKINAAKSAAEAIIESRFNSQDPVVFNYGTAGAINENTKGLHKIGKFYQRDMCPMPLGKRGVTPYEDDLFLETEESTLINKLFMEEQSTLSIATGDSFATFLDPWYLENNIDLVDMEAYAIAKVCTDLQVPFYCFKYVTDYVGHNYQAELWNKRVSNGISDIVTALSL